MQGKVQGWLEGLNMFVCLGGSLLLTTAKMCDDEVAALVVDNGSGKTVKNKKNLA